MKAFDREGAVLYLSAATKCFAPGLQVGWIVSGPGWRARIESIKSISSAAVDNLPQLVLAEFLAQGGHLPHLRKLRATLRQRVREFEALVQPELGPVRGLGGRGGGFNRYLWLPDGMFDEAIEEACTRAWPDLFTGEMPVFRFKSGGISVNLSFPLDDLKRADLRACAQRLALFSASHGD
jgi:DNA-binding transcriptional MocR family regulator